MEKNDEKNWELIAGKLHGELDPEEIARFENGLEDSQNKLLYSKAQKIHQGLSEVKQFKTSSIEGSWNKINAQIRSKTIQFYAQNFLKYAAILIVAFVGGYFVNQLVNDNNQPVQYAEMEVMYGQTGHLFLFDGTEVWLNSGSKFRYPNKFNRNERNVYLEGEAFFKVVHNEKLPFKVKTAHLEVEDLGTSFNVSAYPQESSQLVVLVEGKVQLNTPQGQKMGEMVPGQIAVKTDGSSSLKIQNTNPYFYTSWKDGKVIFDGERLEDISKKIERWYNVDITFEKEDLKNYRLSGTILRNKPIDQMIMAMEMLAPINFKYEVKTNARNQIIITGK
ncbi:MAG: FecR family protein [Prolixibacteraceae bacterium]|jgi:ferric-dicitrate binding protein FerR (iron transport regulator)